jgi:hypothetical protein
MLAGAFKYVVKHPGLAARVLLSDPFEAWTMLQDRLAERRERHQPGWREEAAEDWERRLHDLLNVAWPCGESSEFQQIWPGIIAPLTARGIRVGPESFNQYNDGDPGLSRAIWCLVRHLRPAKVVETGVARGITSQSILEAFERNGGGHLWSIDLLPLNPALQVQAAMAVEDRHRHRWTYVRGSSRRRLPGLLSRLGQIDLFIHDSLHTQRNTRFELDAAWKAVRPGGALVVDDIDLNGAFGSFIASHPGHASLTCAAEPLRPDVRRFNNRGLFGIIIKGSDLPDAGW